MDPSDSHFAERIRKFPSLTKCCTIDWVQEWPSEALQKVAIEKLGKNQHEVEDVSSVVEAL